MKISFIFVLYQTPIKEIERLKKEVSKIGLSNYFIQFIDNTNTNRGFAAGVNQGIKKALNEKAQLLIIANPDISLKKISGIQLLTGQNHFDIWGLAMKQNKTFYYGGEIDKWRMSGGLIDRKPSIRFVPVDYVSGSLMIIKRKVIDTISLFDEKYFLYYEDVDYCYRAKKAGFRVGIDSVLYYEHKEDSDKTNKQKKYLLERNRLLFMCKFGNINQKLREIIRLPITVLEYFNVLKH